MNGHHLKNSIIRRHLLAILLAVVILFSGTVSAQVKSDSLSLRDALARAFSVDNNIKASQANFNASKSAIGQAKASYLPNISLTGNYYYQSRVNEFSILVPGLGSQNIKTVSDKPFNTRLGIDYQLYTFGRRPTGVKLAREQNNRSELKYVTAKKNLFDSVARLYFVLAYAVESQKLVNEEYIRFEQIVQISRSRFSQDLLSEFDLLQIELRLENYRLTMLEVSNNILIAKNNLARLLGVSPDDLPALSDSLDENILQLPNLSEEDALYNNREDYLDALLAVQIAGLSKKISKSAYFPSVSLFGAYDWRNNYQPDVDKIEDSYSFGVKLNWLLFDGFARRAEIVKQDYYGKAFGYFTDNLKGVIQNQVKNLQLTMENNRSRIDVAASALSVAQRSMAIARTRFDIGDLTMIEFLEAENKLTQSELNLLRLEFEYILAQLDLKKATGYYSEISGPY